MCVGGEGMDKRGAWGGRRAGGDITHKHTHTHTHTHTHIAEDYRRRSQWGSALKGFLFLFLFLLSVYRSRRSIDGEANGAAH